MVRLDIACILKQLTAKFCEIKGSCKTFSNDKVQSWAWLVFESF